MLSEERKNELRDNLNRVREKIEAARIKRGGGDPVALLAATKTVPAEEVEYLVRECGLTLLRAPGLPGKCAPLAAAEAIRDVIYSVLED